jgi:hypothetical protein
MNKIYHVEIKDKEPKHNYFGSKKAIFDTFTKADIGLSLQDLWNTDLEKYPYLYENDKCIIRQGVVRRTKTNRGRK